ncbi:MAG: YcxB family protein, partial [Roseimicrobium sp.]
MTIKSHITDSDYRALQWRVMVHREKIPLLMGLCFGLAAMLLGGSMLAEESWSRSLRIYAVVASMAGAGLLTIIVALHLSRDKALGGKRVPLGPHTFEFAGKLLIVTNQHGKMEVPITGIHSIDEAEKYFFVILRRGADLIIPKRDLDAQQAQAVRDFKEAVAFSSLHIEMQGRDRVSPEQAASSFSGLRWAALPFAVVLP